MCRKRRCRHYFFVVLIIAIFSVPKCNLTTAVSQKIVAAVSTVQAPKYSEKVPAYQK